MMLITLLAILLFDADFQQTRTSSLLDQPQVLTGHMYYAAPDTIRWTYDGADAVALPPQMLRYIQTMIATHNETAEGWITVSPLPKQAKRLFQQIQLRMSGGVAREVVLTEHGGDETRILFLNPTYRIQ